jgi:hypothetical protein
MKKWFRTDQDTIDEIRRTERLLDEAEVSVIYIGDVWAFILIKCIARPLLKLADWIIRHSEIEC